MCKISHTKRYFYDMEKLLHCLFKVHLREEMAEDWTLLLKIPVKSLSSEPDILGGNILKILKGSFFLRVAARNIAGLGATSQIFVILKGIFLYLIFLMIIYISLFPF